SMAGLCAAGPDHPRSAKLSAAAICRRSSKTRRRAGSQRGDVGSPGRVARSNLNGSSRSAVVLTCHDVCERSGKRPTGTGPKWPTPSAEYQRAALLRQKLNRAFTQSDRIALALLCQFDDFPGDDLICGIGPIDQAQRAQGVFERGGEDPDLVRSKHMI